MKIAAVEFVKSAAGVRDLPGDHLPQIAMVGRSNVGKSSLINALVRQRVARTSAAPGKTRLINLYRVAVARGPARPTLFYLADLPGYGYAPGGPEGQRAFERIAGEYFDAARLTPGATREARLKPGAAREARLTPGATREAGLEPGVARGVVLLVDARHPGLARDRAARDWIAELGLPLVVAATKIDQLPRAARENVCRELETTLNAPIAPVSARTGEGLDDLWTLIIKLLSAPPPGRRATSPSSSCRRSRT